MLWYNVADVDYIRYVKSRSVTEIHVCIRKTRSISGHNVYLVQILLDDHEEWSQGLDSNQCKPVCIRPPNHSATPALVSRVRGSVTLERSTVLTQVS